jgi:hypothetical protein
VIARSFLICLVFLYIVLILVISVFALVLVFVLGVHFTALAVFSIHNHVIHAI